MKKYLVACLLYDLADEREMRLALVQPVVGRFPILRAGDTPAGELGIEDKELCTRTSRVQNSAAGAASGSSYTRVGAKLVIFSRIYDEKIKFPSDWNS